MPSQYPRLVFMRAAQGILTSFNKTHGKQLDVQLGALSAHMLSAASGQKPAGFGTALKAHKLKSHKNVYSCSVTEHEGLRIIYSMFKDDEGNYNYCIHDITNHQYDRLQPGVLKKNCEHAKNILRTERLLNEITAARKSAFDVELTPHQRQVKQELTTADKKHVLLTGRAGTGKTLLICQRMAEILKANPTQEIIYLAPSERLCHEIENLWRANYGETFPNAKISFINSSKNHRRDLITAEQFARWWDNWKKNNKQLVDAAPALGHISSSLVTLEFEIADTYSEQLVQHQAADEDCKIDPSEHGYFGEHARNQSMLNDEKEKLVLLQALQAYVVFLKESNLDDPHLRSLPLNGIKPKATIFVDEYEGYTARQLTILKKHVERHGQTLVLAGDEFQSAKANSKLAGRIKYVFGDGLQELQLATTHRSTKAINAVAEYLYKLAVAVRQGTFEKSGATKQPFGSSVDIRGLSVDNLSDKVVEQIAPVLTIDSFIVIPRGHQWTDGNRQQLETYFGKTFDELKQYIFSAEAIRGLSASRVFLWCPDLDSRLQSKESRELITHVLITRSEHAGRQRRSEARTINDPYFEAEYTTVAAIAEMSLAATRATKNLAIVFADGQRREVHAIYASLNAISKKFEAMLREDEIQSKTVDESAESKTNQELQLVKRFIDLSLQFYDDEGVRDSFQAFINSNKNKWHVFEIAMRQELKPNVIAKIAPLFKRAPSPKPSVRAEVGNATVEIQRTNKRLSVLQQIKNYLFDKSVFDDDLPVTPDTFSAAYKKWFDSIHDPIKNSHASGARKKNKKKGQRAPTRKSKANDNRRVISWNNKKCEEAFYYSLYADILVIRGCLAPEQWLKILIQNKTGFEQYVLAVNEDSQFWTIYIKHREILLKLYISSVHGAFDMRDLMQASFPQGVQIQTIEGKYEQMALKILQLISNISLLNLKSRKYASTDFKLLNAADALSLVKQLETDTSNNVGSEVARYTVVCKLLADGESDEQLKRHCLYRLYECQDSLERIETTYFQYIYLAIVLITNAPPGYRNKKYAYADTHRTPNQLRARLMKIYGISDEFLTKYNNELTDECSKVLDLRFRFEFGSFYNDCIRSSISREEAIVFPVYVNFFFESFFRRCASLKSALIVLLAAATAAQNLQTYSFDGGGATPSYFLLLELLALQAVLDQKVEDYSHWLQSREKLSSFIKVFEKVPVNTQFGNEALQTLNVYINNLLIKMSKHKLEPDALSMIRNSLFGYLKLFSKIFEPERKDYLTVASRHELAKYLSAVVGGFSDFTDNEKRELKRVANLISQQKILTDLEYPILFHLKRLGYLDTSMEFVELKESFQASFVEQATRLMQQGILRLSIFQAMIECLNLLDESYLYGALSKFYVINFSQIPNYQSEQSLSDEQVKVFLGLMQVLYSLNCGSAENAKYIAQTITKLKSTLYKQGDMNKTPILRYLFPKVGGGLDVLQYRQRLIYAQAYLKHVFAIDVQVDDVFYHAHLLFDFGHEETVTLLTKRDTVFARQYVRCAIGSPLVYYHMRFLCAPPEMVMVAFSLRSDDVAALKEVTNDENINSEAGKELIAEFVHFCNKSEDSNINLLDSLSFMALFYISSMLQYGEKYVHSRRMVLTALKKRIELHTNQTELYVFDGSADITAHLMHARRLAAFWPLILLKEGQNSSKDFDQDLLSRGVSDKYRKVVESLTRERFIELYWLCCFFDRGAIRRIRIQEMFPPSLRLPLTGLTELVKQSYFYDDLFISSHYHNEGRLVKQYLEQNYPANYVARYDQLISLRHMLMHKKESQSNLHLERLYLELARDFLTELRFDQTLVDAGEELFYDTPYGDSMRAIKEFGYAGCFEDYQLSTENDAATHHQRVAADLESMFDDLQLNKPMLEYRLAQEVVEVIIKFMEESELEKYATYYLNTLFKCFDRLNTILTNLYFVSAHAVAERHKMYKNAAELASKVCALLQSNEKTMRRRAQLRERAQIYSNLGVMESRNDSELAAQVRVCLNSELSGFSDEFTDEVLNIDFNQTTAEISKTMLEYSDIVEDEFRKCRLTDVLEHALSDDFSYRSLDFVVPTARREDRVARCVVVLRLLQSRIEQREITKDNIEQYVAELIKIHEIISTAEQLKTFVLAYLDERIENYDGDINNTDIKEFFESAMQIFYTATLIQNSRTVARLAG